MALNPFGNESDSVHAWKERYRQMEIQKNALSQTLAEVRLSLEQTSTSLSSLKAEHTIKLRELEEVRTELLAFREIAKERADKILSLENQMDLHSIDKLRAENKQLQEKIDDLVGELSRGVGSGDEPQASGPDASRLYNALIPLILKEYDPSNTEYADAFKNLIEVAIEEGDILTQIISILFKYGGSGPLDRVREIVKDKKMYNTALEILMDEQIINIIDDEIHIYVKGEDIGDISNWKSLTIPELIEQLISVIEKGQLEQVLQSVDIFRDILTDRGTSATTIFFEMRKLKEGLEKQRLSRKEAIETVENWRSKLVR
ncbi:MAG: hypothetical protein INQ03_12020 [Candidatus Heimdallarchaeota archaeon]|nr:hypothetical protein [Candidatus Heimdallarchaeota archaeon]